MCKDIAEALQEDIIEITWMFDGLIQSGDIPSWNELMDTYSSDDLKSIIKEIARKFEEKYPFETTWVDTDLDYIIEIEEFSKEKLMEHFQYEEKRELDMINGITTCCGYDFGIDMDKAKYCPICGKKLINIE